MFHCGKPMLGVEYAFDHPHHYDGVSEYRCVVCGVRKGRWTKRVLTDGEWEPPWGEDDERRVRRQT
jgi:hypothetical protein